MDRKIIITGVFLGMLAIAIGAFATHGLKPRISADAIITFETGARYQMYHALFLMLLGGISLVSNKIKRICFFLTVLGVVLFSGSIYLLATNTLTSFDFRSIALLTPLGGTLLILAWMLLLINLVKLKKK